MVKILIFVLMIIGIIFYPVYSVYGNKTAKHADIKKINIPDVEIIDGKFRMYAKVLEKTGKFKFLIYYKKNFYIIKDTYVRDLLSGERYRAEKNILKNDDIIGYNVFYRNNDFELITSKAVYNKNKKILKGEKFKLTANNFKGEGKFFIVDKNKNLSASNIKYYLKVDK